MLTFAIGDIHGCYRELLLLWQGIEEYAAEHGQPFMVVTLGDYVDRGPASSQVIQFLIEKKKVMGDNLICLKGNHEDMFLARQSWGGFWKSEGGDETMASYRKNGKVHIPKEHVDFIKSLRLYYSNGRQLFVHAAIHPHKTLAEQTEDVLLWDRSWLKYRGRYAIREFVVHGHTSVWDFDERAFRVNIDTSCVFGGKLTAAVFDDREDDNRPVVYLQVESGYDYNYNFFSKYDMEERAI